jgi:hypothetical protein
MNCNDTARTTPRTLEIVSLVASEAGRCIVHSELPASHEIVIRNWGGIPYRVDIHGKCQTPCVRYRGTDGLLQKSWVQNSLVVQSYPGAGEPPVRVVASQPLTSRCAARAESIMTTVTWVVQGLLNSGGRDSLGAQVNTL